jgi:hypothetical protein
MADEIAVTDEFRQYILLKHRNRAGIKADFLIKELRKALRNYHICGSYEWSDSLRKGVNVYDSIIFIKRIQGFFGLAAGGELGFEVILYDKSVSLDAPLKVFCFFRG